MSCLRLHSRTSVPTAPRKYLVVTIVEALTDQKSGNSTPRCSKTVSPVFQFCWTTSRRSHVTASYGWTPGVVKIRSIFRPLARLDPAWRRLSVSVMVSPASVFPGRGTCCGDVTSPRSLGWRIAVRRFLAGWRTLRSHQCDLGLEV